MLYHEELFTKSSCSNCRSEIAGLGIECVECHDGNFRICAECFSVGAEIGQHKKDHAYRFFDSGSLALFPGSTEGYSSNASNENQSSKRWAAKEEIRLLDAIEQYGFGNWQDISKHIETRGAQEAKDEFVQRYVNGNIGQVSWGDRNNNAETGTDLEFKRNIGIFPEPVDHTTPCDDGPLSPSLTQRLPPLDISSEEILQLGYMPYRDDYEKEFDNEAETLVAQLTFAPEDDDIDVGVKLSLVDIYSNRLRERARRKRVIRDYQLVSIYFRKDKLKAVGTGAAGVDIVNGDDSETPKRFQGYERHLQDKIRPFVQFYNAREYDHVIRNLVMERDLILRVTELQKYRLAGITNVEDCQEYERRKAAQVSLRGKRSALTTVAEEEAACHDGRSHKKAMMESPVLIQHLLQPNPDLGSEKSENESASAVLKPTQPLSSNDDSSSKDLESNESDSALLPQILEARKDPFVIPEVLEEDLFSPNEKPKDSGDLFTVNCPDFDLLSSPEIKVCKKLRLFPKQFLSAKLACVLGRLGDTDKDKDTNDENSDPGLLGMNQCERSYLTDFLKSITSTSYSTLPKKQELTVYEQSNQNQEPSC